VGTVTFVLRANARQVGRSRALRDRATAILRYYTSILGEAPYPGFSLVVVDALLPGGHSPAYFALLHQPLPTSPFRWENDPVSFEAFPAFFLAHEVAHQWWGQAVGWQNYHEQWLSEGLAQYFAVLYAAHTMGPEALGDLMRQMHRWAMRYTDEGPIWLGYRLGHVRGESRIFRAIVYNKSAMVLHMLRRLVGDERFFAGLARFYREFKFRKAGTDEFRRVMEQESGLPLERFFERWIFGARLPRLRVSWRVVSAADPTAGRGALVLRVEQEGEVFDVPLTVTLTYASGARRSLVIPVTERVVERTVALEDRLARVTTNDDFAALAEIVR
jgi:aminopeptidase N